MQENLDTQASSNLQVTTPFVVDFASLSKALPQYLLAPLSLIPVSPPFNVEKCLKNLGGNSPELKTDKGYSADIVRTLFRHCADIVPTLCGHCADIYSS